MEENKHGLGRISIPDANDFAFPVKSILPKQVSITSKYWFDNTQFLDQGNEPQCVGYSWKHWLLDAPVMQKNATPKPDEIYHEAQFIDDWPGEEYEGTSVRAGAKVLQARGYISSYLWAFDLPTMVNTVLTMSPVVIGINWYDDMFEPDKNGLIRIGGNLAGGHAIVCNGVNTKTKLFRLKNSWSSKWSKNGRCYITFADMERLIHENGEVCVAVEVKN